MDTGKTWLKITALLAFLGAVVAPLNVMAGSALAFMAAGLGFYRAFRSDRAVAAPLPEQAARASDPPTLPDVERAEPTRSPPAQSAISMPAPASLADGGYERLRKLADGSMGALWLVRHRQLDRIAALKEIKRGDVRDEDLERFNREARVLSQLRCPHTIQIYDFGVGQDGFPYYVMEHLEGEDLQTLVSEVGPMPPARVMHVLRQVCLCLEEAHQAGLVHRDIKPANVMLCHYGTLWDFVKLLDFGLVKRSPEQDRTNLTRDAVVLGTPAYLAPESLAGSKFVDGRADLYALGAVGFYLLTGRLLFDHDQPVRMAKAHLLEPAPRASEHVSGPLPEELDQLLDDCLKKEPDERPQSARELIERLDSMGAAEPWSQEQARECWLEYRARQARSSP